MARTLVSQANLRSFVVRDAAPLTTSFIASDAFNVQGANQLQLLVSFSKGDSTGCHLKIEFSEDKNTWYQESALALSEECDVANHKAVVRNIDSIANI